MLYLWLIVSTAWTFSFANPIPNDSDDPILNSNTELFIPNVEAESNVDTVSKLASSSFSPNEATVANSIPGYGSGCALDVSMNDGFNVDIQKRAICPATDQNPHTQSSPQPPAEDTKKSTSPSHNPCDSEFSYYLSCAGREVVDINGLDTFTLVMNCVPAVSQYIYRRPPHFDFGTDRDRIAEYCCQYFYPAPLLYAGIICKKMTPNVRILQFDVPEFNSWWRMITKNTENVDLQIPRRGREQWYRKIRELPYPRPPP